jgi:predicted aspartyl protease
VGIFRVDCRLQHIADRDRDALVPQLLVDTGSECTWIPATVLENLGVKREKKDVPFLLANGQQVTRKVGFAIIHVQDAFTVDEVVFAEEGDLALLGSRTLEGLNLTVDPTRKKLRGRGTAAGRRNTRIAHRFFSNRPNTSRR